MHEVAFCLPVSDMWTKPDQTPTHL
jgi:hypothetical protein